MDSDLTELYAKGGTSCLTTTSIDNCTVSDGIQWYYRDKDGVTLKIGDQQPKKEGNMETLWNVVLVTKDRDIEEMGSVVAEDEETARFEFANEISRFLRNNKLKLKDVTILCVELGSVKVREEVKKVQVVDNG